MHVITLSAARLVTVTLLVTTFAAEAAEVSIGTGLRRFDYEEFSTTGDTLNRETGFIPGINAALTQEAITLSHTLRLAFWDGRVDYDGRTQGGQSHRTDTDETVVHMQYRVDWQPAEAGGGVFAALIWSRWDRDILPANGVSGLFERYQWWTLEAGIRGELLRRNNQRLNLEFGVLVTREGIIEIDLTKEGFGNNTLGLGDGQGFTGALDYAVDLAHGNRLRFRLEYVRWNFGRSDTRAVSNGSSTIFIAEPDSDSNHISLRIEYVLDF